MSTYRYDNLLEPISVEPLTLLYVSAAKYEGDWHSTLHAHRCTELFLVTESQGRFCIENDVFTVQRDNLIIINPNVMHTEMATEPYPMEYIVLGIEGGEFLLNNSSDNRYCIINCAKENKELRDCIQRIWIEVKERRYFYTVLSNALLRVLEVNLLRCKNITVSQSPTNKINVQCAVIKRYIDEHFKENITLDKLAQVAFLNKHYLIHIFVQEYAASPINYMMHRRIEEASYLLAQTNYNISEIALMLGFSSASSFSQVFSRNNGISPSQFRRQNNTWKQKRIKSQVSKSGEPENRQDDKKSAATKAP